MIVLGIETSCDETGVAIYDSDKGLLSDTLYSQVLVHADYGGVVPELASRDHIRKLSPLIAQSINQAKLKSSKIQGIGYTAGPGLVGALLTGAALARALAWSWQIPALGIHHMEGHLLSPLLETDPPGFPFVALLISGGHTLLVQVTAIGDYRIMGETLDDAAGEAFDKAANMLGLNYPGGPALAELAEKGEANRFRFPRPMTNRPGMDFSFSGLKTYTRNIWKDTDDSARADIAWAFQDAVGDTLAIKCRRALQATGFKRLVVSGGVSANKSIRSKLISMAEKEKTQVFFPRMAFCTDNGAMIAFAACLRLLSGQQEDLEIRALPRWPLDTLDPLSPDSLPK